MISNQLQAISPNILEDCTSGVAVDSPGTNYIEDYIKLNKQSGELGVAIILPPHLASKLENDPLVTILERHNKTKCQLIRECRRQGASKVHIGTAICVVLEKLKGQVMPAKIEVEPFWIRGKYTTQEADRLLRYGAGNSEDMATLRKCREFTKILLGIEKVDSSNTDVRTMMNVLNFILTRSKSSEDRNGENRVPNHKHGNHLSNLLPILSSLKTSRATDLASFVQYRERKYQISRGPRQLAANPVNNELAFIVKHIRDIVARYESGTLPINKNDRRKNNKIKVWLDSGEKRAQRFIDLMNQGSHLISNPTILKHLSEKRYTLSCSLEIAGRTFVLAQKITAPKMKTAKDRVKKALIKDFLDGKLLPQ